MTLKANKRRARPRLALYGLSCSRCGRLETLLARSHAASGELFEALGWAPADNPWTGWHCPDCRNWERGDRQPGKGEGGMG